MPSIDVIVPCYNYGRFLEECVTSIMGQSLRPARIVVIDDGSDDDSPAVLSALARTLPIEPVLQANAGLVATLRRGIAMTDSELFVTVSSDDRLRPEFLQRCAEALQRFPDAGYCYTEMAYFGNRSGLAPTRSFDAKALVCAGNFVGGGALIRRSAYDRTPGFREIAGLEDWDLWLSFLDEGFVGVYVDEPLYEWRQHGASRNAAADQSRHSGRRLRRRVQSRHPRLLARHYPGYLPTAMINFSRRIAGRGPRPGAQ